jgi:hypothetical protein
MIPATRRNEAQMLREWKKDPRFGPYIPDPRAILQRLYDERVQRDGRQAAQAKRKKEQEARMALAEVDRLTAMIEQRAPNLRYVTAQRQQMLQTIAQMT